MPIFCSLSDSIRAAITKYHGLGSLQTTEFISHSTGGWLGESPSSWFIAGAFSLFPHMVEGTRDQSGASLIKQ